MQIEHAPVEWAVISQVLRYILYWPKLKTSATWCHKMATEHNNNSAAYASVTIRYSGWPFGLFDRTKNSLKKKKSVILSEMNWNIVTQSRNILDS